MDSTHGRGGVSEITLRHKVVGLDDLFEVGTVDTNRDSHHHVLRSLDNLAVDSEEVRSLERLETEVVVSEISVVDDGRVEQVFVLHDDLVNVVRDHGRILARLGVDPLVQVIDDGREGFLGLLVQVGDGDSSCKDGVIRVLGRQVSCRLSREVLPNVSFTATLGVRRHSRQARRW